jgi:hypothetical protein
MPFPDGKTKNTREMHSPFRWGLGTQMLFFQAFKSVFLHARNLPGMVRDVHLKPQA